MLNVSLLQAHCISYRMDLVLIYSPRQNRVTEGRLVLLEGVRAETLE